MIKHDATIRKADIMRTAELRRMINDAAVTIDGVTYGTGTLRFLCFSGALDLPSGLYRGAFCFEPVKDVAAVRPGGVADFDTLLAMDVTDTPTSMFDHVRLAAARYVTPSIVLAETQENDDEL